MALQQSGADKDEAVRQAKDAQQCVEAELRAQEKLFEQKEAQLTAELEELGKKLDKAVKDKNVAITGMNLANTSTAEHEVTIGDLYEKIGDLEARIATLLTSATAATPATGGESSGAGQVEPGSQPASEVGEDTGVELAGDDGSQPEVKRSLVICPICDIMGTYEEVEQHMKDEHVDTHHICTECIQCFSTKMLNTHMQHHKDKKEECEQCRKKYLLKAELKEHVKVMHEKAFKCEKQGCGKTYSHEQDLRRHQKEAHEKKVIYICKVQLQNGKTCGKRMTGKQSYKNHHRTFHNTEDESYHKEHTDSTAVPLTP